MLVFHLSAILVILLGGVLLCFLFVSIGRFIPDVPFMDVATPFLGLVLLISVFIWLLVVRTGIYKLAPRVRAWDQAVFQKYRDSKANEILGVLLGTDTSAAQKSKDPFYLYLRPFASTGNLPQMTKSDMTTFSKSLYIDLNGSTEKKLYEDLETIIARIVLPKGLLITLGKPGELVGAGRIPSDDKSWKLIFLKLAADAKAIFLLPSMHQGTQTEIAAIISEDYLLRKTIFIVPPKGIWMSETDFKMRSSQPTVLDRKSSSRFHAGQPHTFYQVDDSIQAMQALGLNNLPDLSAGLLLRIGPDRAVVSHRPLAIYHEPWYLMLYNFYMRMPGASHEGFRFNMRKLRKSINELEMGSIDDREHHEQSDEVQRFLAIVAGKDKID